MRSVFKLDLDTDKIDPILSYYVTVLELEPAWTESQTNSLNCNDGSKQLQSQSKEWLYWQSYNNVFIVITKLY